MKPWLYLLVGIIVVLGVMYALSAVVGLIFWVGIVGFILACIAGLFNSAFGNRLRLPSKRAEKKLDTAAERALQEIEQKIQR